MALSTNLLRLQQDLLERLRSFAQTQTTVSAQDLHTGNFVPAYAVSLLPRLVEAGLLEEQAIGGMRGGSTYRFRDGVGPTAAKAIATYLAALGARGFTYEPPVSKASPLRVHTRQGLAEVVD